MSSIEALFLEDTRDLEVEEEAATDLEEEVVVMTLTILTTLAGLVDLEGDRHPGCLTDQTESKQPGRGQSWRFAI